MLHRCLLLSSIFFFRDSATIGIYTLSLHDALPNLDGSIWGNMCPGCALFPDLEGLMAHQSFQIRSEEHTSELQSQFHLVCRLLLEKKKTLPIKELSTSIEERNTS